MSDAAMSDDPVDAIDAIMTVMRDAFDPDFGEAWTQRQVTDALTLGNIRYILYGQTPDEPISTARTEGFVLSRHAADEVELLLIAVKRQHRGKGIGRAIMQRFLDEARRCGARKVFLEMRDGNPARHLYQACGFAQIGVRKGYYRGAVGGPIDAITFGREI